MKSNAADASGFSQTNGIPPIKMISRLIPGWSGPPNQDPNRISHDQLWLDRNGIVYFEIRHGAAPIITTGNKSILTIVGVQQILAELAKLQAPNGDV